MSDNIPVEIQAEIIKSLPDVKSLIRFTPVSKQWKSLIQSPEFIARYHAQHTDPRHHLLVSYIDPLENHVSIETKYVSIVDNDNDSFPQHKFPITAPISAKLLDRPSLIGSSHGLFLFFGYLDKRPTQQAVIWNPSIRKSFDIVVPNVLRSQDFETVVCFGVSPHTLDPMLVKITFTLRMYPDDQSIPMQVEIFTLSSRVWRSPSCSSSSNLRRKLFNSTPNQVVVDEFIYWVAFDPMFVDEAFYFLPMILSFNMTTEEFTEIYLPDTILSLELSTQLFVCKLRESLVVLACLLEQKTRIWCMDDGVTKSFTKLFNIGTPEASILNVLGFRNCGQPFIAIGHDCKWEALFVYEPVSQHIYFVGIYGKINTLFTSSYVEIPLLLDQ